MYVYNRACVAAFFVVVILIVYINKFVNKKYCIKKLLRKDAKNLKTIF